MFRSVESRYVLRSCLAGALSGLSVLSVSMADGGLTAFEGVGALVAAGIAGLSYAGIGAASAPVEPNIGNTMSHGEGLER